MEGFPYPSMKRWCLVCIIASSHNIPGSILGVVVSITPISGPPNFCITIPRLFFLPYKYKASHVDLFLPLILQMGTLIQKT